MAATRRCHRLLLQEMVTTPVTHAPLAARLLRSRRTPLAARLGSRWISSKEDTGVRVVASLPCYSSKNVNQQRGNKVFERSIKGLQLLNDVGYGAEGSGLYMDLVYNPLGAFLPPPQEALEGKYKEELDAVSE